MNGNMTAGPEISPTTWIVSCPSCGRWKTIEEIGGRRIGTASIGKRILTWCGGCRWMRWARVEQARNITPERWATMRHSAETR